MSQVRFFALGGLGEDGKNMYVFDVDGRLFVLDAGLKYPTQDLLGVDAILPNYQYLIDHQSQIEGFFLSHGHEDHIGALPKILRDINVPIYGSFFTLELLKDTLKQHQFDEKKLVFNTVSKDSVLTFKTAKIRFYQTTHSIPGSLGIAVDTADGMFVYSPDYTFDQNVDPIYQTSFDKIQALTQKKVIALFSESLGAHLRHLEATDTELDLEISQAFINRKKRIIVSAFSTDIYRIQRVINIALKYHRKIAIIGRKAQRMIDIAINTGLLKIPKEQFEALKFIEGNKIPEKPENLMVLVAGDRHEPFHMVQRMVLKQDRLIHLDNEDTVLMMTPPVPGTEKIASRTLDILYRHNINIHKIDKAMLPPAHASSSDVKLLNNILKPTYFVPVIGEHRHFFHMRQIAHQLGYEDDHIFTLENGHVLKFIDGVVTGETDTVSTGEILVDGSLEESIHDVVLKDREILSQDGVIIVSAAIHVRSKKVIGLPEISSRGFIYVKENETLLTELQEMYKASIEKGLQAKQFEFRTLRDNAKDVISKYVFDKTLRRPIIIPAIVTVEDDKYTQA